MKYIDEIKSVDMADIANMILLAEDIEMIAEYGISSYDENGIELALGSEDHMAQIKKDRANGTEELVSSIICDKDTTILDAAYIEADKLMEKLSPVRSRVLKMFRNGVENIIYGFRYADSSVPDDWLFALFAMQVRNRMISAASYREDVKEKKE